MNDFPNSKRNMEVELAIGHLKNADLGASAQRAAGIAESLSSLNIAESLQLLQLQTEESSLLNRKTIASAIDKLIESNTKLGISNDNHAKAMRWLTAALVGVGIVQIIVSFIK